MGSGYFTVTIVVTSWERNTKSVTILDGNGMVTGDGDNQPLFQIVQGDGSEDYENSHSLRTKQRCGPYGDLLCTPALFPLYFSQPPMRINMPKIS